MTHSEAELRSNGDKAPPYFRPLQTGNTLDRF